jgi:molybdopterin-guanine dinucleotide biosynthesis protein A
MTAVVLAGGGRDEVCDADPAAPNKAFVAIGGRTLVERTIAALRSSSRVGTILAVAPEAAFGRAALAGADALRPSGARMADSLRSGLAGLPPGDLVLVAASDLPILSAEAVDEFVDAAVAFDADIAYACVEQRTHLARFPDVPHTWARMRDGSYCGGGLVAIRPRALDALERFLGRLGDARKNPLQLASIFGWEALARYAAGRLSIADAERRAHDLLGVPARAVVCSRAEVAVNVDRSTDVALAERLVSAAPSSD